MRFKTWPVAALALGALLLLVAAAVLESSRRAQDIFARLDEVNSRYHEVEGKLRRLRSDVNLSGIYVRDYLLDPDRERAPHYRQRIVDYRRQNRAAFDELRQLAGMDAASTQQLTTLGTRLDEYWQKLDPLFDWTQAEKLSESARFLRWKSFRAAKPFSASPPRSRTSTTRRWRRSGPRCTQQARASGRDLNRLLGFSLLLGAVVAVTTVIRLRRLDAAPTSSVPPRRKPSGRCASSRSSSSPRRKTSARSSRASCTTTSARC